MGWPYYIARAELIDAHSLGEFGLACEYSSGEGCSHVVSWAESFELVILGDGKREVWCMSHQDQRDDQQVREEGVHG
jgi:hypothetical protein